MAKITIYQSEAKTWAIVGNDVFLAARKLASECKHDKTEEYVGPLLTWLEDNYDDNVIYNTVRKGLSRTWDVFVEDVIYLMTRMAEETGEEQVAGLIVVSSEE